MLRFARPASRVTLYGALLVCILTTLVGSVTYRSRGVRSWEDAIALAQTELQAAGDLAERLEDYERSANSLSATIDVLDQARPALDVIERLREVRVPLLGDGWQILLALVSLVTADGTRIIATLEETLNTLSGLKDSLDDLTGLQAAAGAVREFRANPNRRTLDTLAAAGAVATPSLRQLHANLGEVLVPLTDVAGKLTGLVKGLRGAADVDIPAISDAARFAAERIGLIEEPLLELRDRVNQLYENIGTDVEVLSKIEEGVQKAREHKE